jgi:hypothetical protein
VYTIFEKRLPQREEATEQRIVRDPAVERRRDNFTERHTKTSARESLTNGTRKGDALCRPAKGINHYNDLVTYYEDDILPFLLRSLNAFWDGDRTPRK